ncbi:MAG: lytic transglycosylase domain-containing protein [Treponema sp.]|nr:lytic transglycosylase domain-containing protein [Treponema sp.]
MVGGAAALSFVFLTVCLCVHFLVPAESDAELLPASNFNSYTSLLDFDVAEDAAENAGLKNDYIDDFSSKDDRGLALYRQPKTRPAVEWFYTHVTSSREVALAILENADKNDIPLSMAFALAYVESRFKPDAVNKNGNYTVDRGLFQLNSASFPRLTEEDFFNPEISAKYGMMHLRFCIDMAGNEVTALAMYNAGTTRVKNNNTPRSTLNYVGKIEQYRANLENMFQADILAFYDAHSSTELALATPSSGEKK